MGSIELKDGSSELKNSGGDVKVEAGEAKDIENGWQHQHPVFGGDVSLQAGYLSYHVKTGFDKLRIEWNTKAGGNSQIVSGGARSSNSGSVLVSSGVSRKLIRVQSL